MAEDTAAAEATLPPVGAVLDERFELRASLGEGGMGHVYRAFDRQRGREVALKLIVPRYRGRQEREQRFLRELELGQRAESHPHLVVMLDGGRLGETGWPFLVMELVEGKSLDRQLARGPLRPHVAARTARMIAGAVRALHRKGVVHRDITPANVLARGESIVLIDLSHAGDAHAPRLPVGHPRRLTRENEIPGTHHYMPPEQARSEPAHPAMDVYAFGVTLAQMLVGLTLHQYSRETYLQLQLEGKIRPPRVDIRIHTAVPRRLAELVDACTALDPAERPTMDEVAQWLDEVMAAMVMPAAGSGPLLAVVQGGERGASPSDRLPRTERVVPRPAFERGPTPISPPPPLDTDEILAGTVPAVLEPEPAATRMPWGKAVATALVVMAVVVAGFALWWSLQPEPEADGSSERSEHGSVAPESVLPRSEQPDPGPGPQPSGASASSERSSIGVPGSEPRPAVEPKTAEPKLAEPSDVVTPDEPATAEPPARAEPSTSRKPKAPTTKPKQPAPSPAKTPRPADGEECVALRAETEQAAASAAWTKVAKLTKRRECWSSQGDRKRLRVRALFETQAWSACVDEGQGLDEPQVKQWVDLCQRHVD
ncbi:protein kinase [Paraliomyxa miuraensis]|nr:protein kinase [Paraliomyxa miuraensis]